MTTCPHCQKELTHLDYTMTIGYIGTCSPDGSDLNPRRSETEYQEYTCPHCLKEIELN